MAAQALAKYLHERGIYYGWVVVAITFCFMVGSTASMSMAGVLVPDISREFGWSTGEISGPLGLRFALFGLVAPFAGALMIKYGTRAVVSGSAALMVLGISLALAMTTKLQLWVSVGILLGFAAGLTSIVLSATVATRWFTARRGMVLGLLSGASATGYLIFLPVGAWIAQTYGWRFALAPFLLVMAALAVLFWLLARNDPYELGLAPLGEDKPRAPTYGSASSAIKLSFTTLREASGSLVFWVLAFSFFVCGVSSFGLIQPHFVALCADFGVPSVTAASLLAVIGVFDLIGTTASGWLSDRYDNRWLLVGYYTFRGLALMWLPYSDFTIVGLSIFAVFFGLDFIATVPPTAKISAKAFGREKGPIVFGWVFAAHQIGAALMAYSAGVSRDLLASYLPSVFAAGLLCLAAALSFALLRGWGRTAPANLAPA
jgi:predicted MFS family arabinose efflux permease